MVRTTHGATDVGRATALLLPRTAAGIVPSVNGWQ